ncbi:lysin B [Mycobacterium phage Soul22]|uniref:Lysin B n=1 Tax=Mycobacterium phage Soul22 TaxID=2743996 RepID=A0A7D5K741_9CAUD|nr:lysin B [Mycobacterium phage Soul22]QLF84257.1 lysin B [Mycobacterium phage Soul22]
MRIANAYVGLGEGDISPEVGRVKQLLKKKFTPARNTIDDSDVFTPALTAEVKRIQGIYTIEGKPGAPHYIAGVVNLEFKYDVGLLKRPAPVLPIIFTQEGHQSNMFFGPCASTASQLEQQGVCHWKPIGDWNTAALPFDKSGIDAWVRQLSRHEIEGPPVDPNNPNGPKIMWPFPPGTPWGGIGFSRGAKDFCDFMTRHVIPVNAPLHYRLADFRRGLAFGNPRRAKDAICSWAQSPPDPGTHGIMDRLFDARALGIADRWAENANDEDMFAEVGDDAAGKNQTAIARIITENSWIGGPTALFSRVLTLFGNPVGEGFGIVKAIFDAVMFLAANPNPHYSTFATPGDVEWMRGVAT